MSPKTTRIDRRMTSTTFVLTILGVVVGCVCPASAQWRAVDAQNAWSGYQNAFLKLEPDNYSKVFVKKQGDPVSSYEYMWQQSEEIEVAEDAYYENPTTANKNTVQALCDGFVNYVFKGSFGGTTGDDWSADTYNDDLLVTVIAFARAYNVTGTTRWLTDAENNFTVVWNRAQAGDGGLCENTGGGKGCYENSSANWTFVIAGRILYNYTGDATHYKNPADGVYSWALTNLYIASSGGIADGKGGAASNYTYNYGYAIGAMNEEGASASTVGNVANYVFNDLNNFEEPVNGYNIMPDYSNGETILNQPGNGFNGILMRWVDIANGHGLISSSIIAAAQANMNQAWSERNGSTTLVWDDWDAATPSTGTYSWNDSSALAGLLDIPPTA